MALVVSTQPYERACGKPDSSQTHQTIKMSAGEILVDEEIAVIVEWLNSYPTIQTRSSCQGGISWKEGDKTITSRPYVAFIAWPDVEWLLALDELQKYGIVEVNCYRGMLRYVARFDSIEKRDELTQWIASGNVRTVSGKHV